MRALIQRVSQATVSANDNILGRIDQGLVIFVGISKNDNEADSDYVVSKTLNLRIFSGEEGRFNFSALDTSAHLLVVSQFTLYANTRKGRRPSFIDAALPEDALVLFNETVAKFRQSGLKVETGQFQTHMSVSLENDGPVTVMLDSDDINLSKDG